MQFDFNEDQRLLQKTVRDFLTAECTPAVLRELWDSETGRSRELWSKLAEIGVLGLLVPEEYGGMGLDEIDLVLILEETGRAALAEPIVSTVAVAVPLLLGLDSAELRERWLGNLAEGREILPVGHPINAFLSDAHIADTLLLIHQDEIHIVPREGVGLIREPANDPSRRLFSVRWTPSKRTRAADGSEGAALAAAALDRGALAVAAQQLGVTQQLIDLSVAYANQRVQFGKAIGSFQAIKHLLADLQVGLEYARPAVYRAAHSVARETRSRSLDVSMGAAAASQAALKAAKVALQVHGAIGYTWEQDLHIWMRRAWSLDLAWGSSAWHRARVAAAVLDRAAPAESFGYSAPGP